ncbi:hypothetical protein SDC9_149118 [bioreactor metagenome]|uniref:Uncharacterized protein n=1 Tax=bioreactor metagenome TaxID=1076179 RepID=A0A645EIR1_9ZZZZ
MGQEKGQNLLKVRALLYNRGIIQSYSPFPLIVAIISYPEVVCRKFHIQVSPNPAIVTRFCRNLSIVASKSWK